MQALEEAGPTRECCEALKRTAQELGIPGAAGMDCSLPARERPNQTPGGELRIDSTYEGVCPCATGASPTNRCTILGASQALVALGPKAAVFTAQCYGGQCPGAPGIPGAVMDLMTQTSFSNYPAPERCDDEQVSLDLKGQATYCRDTTPAVPDREPWKGPATGQCTGGAAIDLMPGAPSALRTLQGSLETRGSWANGWIRNCQTHYTGAGWKQFNAANAGGNPNTLVELAPAVANAGFDWWNGVFSASFTSALKPGCRVQVELSGGTRKTISTNPVATSATCGPGGVSVQLSGDPAWMWPFEWASPEGGGAPVPRQNGCTCAGGVGKDFCFVGTCVVCDENGFCGNWSSPGMNPADCPGSYRRFDGTWHLWHDCCPVAVNGETRCEATVVELTPPPDECQPGDTGHASWTWYQHIARPWDTNGPQRCAPIEELWYCVEH